MSSLSYDIHRWDSILNSNPKSITHSESVPALYILPDNVLMTYIRANNFEIPVKITGTNSIYDNKLAMAKCQPSQNTAGYRPNFQAETNYIVIAPDVYWEGYPRDLGQIHILADNEVFTSIQNHTGYPVENSNNNNTISPYFIIAIVVLLIILF